jgi:Lar family restriction alleviation protein
MAKEVLAIPESHLADVVALIKFGLSYSLAVDPLVKTNLEKWCFEQQQYLARLAIEDSKPMKECPFCGTFQWQVVEYQPGYFKLMCKGCGASGPTSDNQKDCIRGWNVRIKDREV